MDRDIVRRLLTRRQTLGLAGLAGAAYLVGGGRVGQGLGLPELPDAEDAAAQAPACVLSPAVTEGPYFVDELLNRSDIREDRAGVPLLLRLSAVAVTSDGCVPAQGAVVDVWHSDAAGKYSDVPMNGTVGQKWLRGLQATDANGLAQFTTIYPGWYAGRTPHIHFKVRVFSGTTKTYEFTSQIFFNELVTALVYAQAPYSARGPQNTTNAGDGIYNQSGGSTLITPASDGAGGYVGTLTIGLSGVPSSAVGTPGESVAAALLSVRFLRTKRGARRMRIRLKVQESLFADARLLRGSRTLARKRTKLLKPGTRTLTLRIGSQIRGGSARLKLTLKDTGGNVKTVRRRLRIPKRAR
ncbi:MAG: intradiol ring-cleavage dioxygenase [Chloroflexota bacterium]|nr:intradiol ring-cleavage dioxygenase [Chloroflexota bacterium]